jgi:hypothetical protein
MKKLICFSLFFLVISCQKVSFEFIEHTYTIRQGNHHDAFEPIIILPDTRIEGTIQLDPSMLAQESFISKLVGISGMNNHKNSARIGWRTVGEQIQLVTYVYNDYESPMEDPETMLSLGLYTPPVTVNYRIYHAGEYWYFQVDENTAKVAGRLPAVRYLSMPWYGGHPSSPHDIRITISYRNLHF